MISVLIPVYNYNIVKLVATLNSQLLLANIDFEIICIDDASSDYYTENDSLPVINNVTLHKLPINIGRSNIRNLLAKKAKYEWLLFLDADVLPENKYFINKYLDCINSNKGKVFCGGIKYNSQKPRNEKLLRWVFGKNREEIDVAIRQKKTYQYFFGSNFLIHKSVFDSCLFNEKILKYGYEDVFFAEDLRNNQIPLTHLSNEVLHLGIENNKVFLEKTKQAIENLYSLTIKNEFKIESVKILRTYSLISIYKLVWFFSSVFVVFNKLFEYNLKSKIPSMFIFDIYKLTYFCFLNRKEV